ncbi:unnamed protein product [Protopolystoma xenopodis]|uniref:Uncharacterized protein n=1 Tax=Protopolystoma xenopodis TaxID=117903 RepID=A0A3S5FD01_9PLAT|nr:unnamed protein product [Protopolystoma xenopodis]
MLGWKKPNPPGDVIAYYIKATATGIVDTQPVLIVIGLNKEAAAISSLKSCTKYNLFLQSASEDMLSRGVNTEGWTKFMPITVSVANVPGTSGGISIKITSGNPPTCKPFYKITAKFPTGERIITTDQAGTYHCIFHG